VARCGVLSKRLLLCGWWLDHTVKPFPPGYLKAAEQRSHRNSKDQEEHREKEAGRTFERRKQGAVWAAKV
jgi:hypothetical protein